MPERVVITGSRHWSHVGQLERRLERFPRDTVFAHGHCPEGADHFTDRWAKEWKRPCERYPVDRKLDGPWPAAGHHRNERMVDDFQPTQGIAFRAPGLSNGTDGCAAYMRSKGIPVEVVTQGQLTLSEPPVCVTLSVPAARFLCAAVAHMNTVKALPPGSSEALQTSAWLEEIEAMTSRALGEHPGDPMTPQARSCKPKKPGEG